MKRLLSFVLVAMMLVSIVPFQASAAPGDPVDVACILNEGGDSTTEKTVTVTNTEGATVSTGNVETVLAFDRAKYDSWKFYYSIDNGANWTEMADGSSINLTADTQFAINAYLKTAFDVSYTVNFTDAAGGTAHHTATGTWTDVSAITSAMVAAAVTNAKGTLAEPTYTFDAPTIKDSSNVVIPDGFAVTADMTGVVITVPTWKEYTVTLWDEKDSKYPGEYYDLMYTTRHVFKDTPKGTPSHDDWTFDRWDDRPDGYSYGNDLDALWNAPLTGNLDYYARYKATTSTNKDNKSDIKIIAKYYIDGVKNDQVTLDIDGLKDLNDGINVYDLLNSGSMKTAVSDAIAAYGWVGNAQWIDGKYYENDAGSEEIDSYDTLSGDRTVYVMVGKKGAVKVQLYVHLTKNVQPEYIINVFGFEDGDTLYKSDIKTVLKDKWPNRTYAFDGLYTDANWTDILAGKTSVTASSSFDVDRRDKTDKGVVNVHIYAKYTSNASDNPKTGDTILMAGTMLGISAAALAVLFFYEKKRRAV